MSNSTNHSECVRHFFSALLNFETDELEVLYDWYTSYQEETFKDQIEAIKAVLRVRNTLVGKTLSL